MSTSNASEGADPSVSEDDVRKYVEKLRSTPAGDIVTELLFGALNAAQVKLGRKDARLFIDLSALLLDRLGDYLPKGVATQVDQALGQLRLGQVQAEGETAGGEPEADDLDHIPTGIATSDQPSSDQPQQPAPSSSAASRLWVPGQDL